MNGHQVELKPVAKQRATTDAGSRAIGPQYRQLAQLAATMNAAPRVWQLQAASQTIQRVPNRTGMPDNLKSGIESLSGLSMDHVRVYRNSTKPAQLNAHAYAQGSEIHLAPGQDQHLPHEAWHLVQQAHGRVQPTRQMKGGIALNDDARLEQEADIMGAKAASTPARIEEDGLAQRRPKNGAPWAGYAVQLKELSRKTISRIDNDAWLTAVAATQHLRPENQTPIKIDCGENDGLDAVTRIRGAHNEVLEVKYYPDNDEFSRTDGATRRGQMTALFNHELAYHGSQEVISKYNTDDESADDEHFAMFDPTRRGNLLSSSLIALEQISDVQSRSAYIKWWENDVKTHIDWDDDRRPSEKSEAESWATKTARKLRSDFLPQTTRRGRKDYDRSHTTTFQRVEKISITYAKGGKPKNFDTAKEAAQYAIDEYEYDVELDELTTLISNSDNSGKFNSGSDFDTFIDGLLPSDSSEEGDKSDEEGDEEGGKGEKEEDVGGEEHSSSDEYEDVEKEEGQQIGKMFFPGDTYHILVKQKIMATIGKKKLSALVYQDNKHTNFDFWIDKDGSIFAGTNNSGGKQKRTGYSIDKDYNITKD